MDNTQLNIATTVGDVIATKDVGGVKHELVVQEFSDGVGGVTEVSPTTPLPVTIGKSSTSAVTSVNDSAVSQTLLAANAGRLGATFFNDSTEILYLKLGATASLTSFTVRMVANAYFEVPFGYIGVIDGIWTNNAAGACRITELTI